MSKSIAIIGAGPAGLEAAISAAPYAQRVALISAGPIADWGQLLSSRIWLQTLERQMNADPPPAIGHFDLPRLRDQTRAKAEAWTARQLQQLQALRVDLYEGRAAFAGPTSLQVGGQTIDADAIVIASGSTPIFPPGFEPDGQQVFSPQTIGAMQQLPRRLVLIGDGPIGFEYAHLFSFLGVDVTWLALAGGPRTPWDPEIDAHLLASLQARGVAVHAGPHSTDLRRGADGVVVTREDGRSFAADAVFISIGFRAALDGLALDRAGLALNQHGFLDVDDYGRTAVPSIYSAAIPGTVSVSRARGRIAALHALGRPVAPFDHQPLVMPSHLCPQAGRVGRLEAEDGSIQTIKVPCADALKTHLIGRTEGFFKLAWDSQRRVTGAAAVGEQAADALTPVGLAIKMGATLDDLAALYGPHPTISELPFAAARRAVERIDA